MSKSLFQHLRRTSLHVGAVVAMSLALTPGGGRTLRYDENLRRDLKLLEVSDDLLEELKEDRCVFERVESFEFSSCSSADNNRLCVLLPVQICI